MYPHSSLSLLNDQTSVGIQYNIYNNKNNNPSEITASPLNSATCRYEVSLYSYTTIQGFIRRQQHSLNFNFPKCFLTLYTIKYVDKDVIRIWCLILQLISDMRRLDKILEFYNLPPYLFALSASLDYSLCSIVSLPPDIVLFGQMRELLTHTVARLLEPLAVVIFLVISSRPP